MKYILIILVLVSVKNVEPKPQYYDSRGIWGTAVDQIVRGTNLQISIQLEKQKLIQGLLFIKSPIYPLMFLIRL